MSVLVTGGAGYIGSHTVVELLNAGQEVVIVDNYSNSKPEVLNRIKTITGKILKAHLVEGEMVKGKEIGIRIDQTLTQDATGTMAYLQAEALGITKAKTEVSVSYIDHNTIGEDFKNPDEEYEFSSRQRY